MEYKDQYYPYKDLCEKGTQVINTKDLNQSNIDNHFYSIINILKDGIESEEVQRMMIHVNFENITIKSTVPYTEIQNAIQKFCPKAVRLFRQTVFPAYLHNIQELRQ